MTWQKHWVTATCVDTYEQKCNNSGFAHFKQIRCFFPIHSCCDFQQILNDICQPLPGHSRFIQFAIEKQLTVRVQRNDQESQHLPGKMYCMFTLMFITSYTWRHLEPWGDSGEGNNHGWVTQIKSSKYERFVLTPCVYLKTQQ